MKKVIKIDNDLEYEIYDNGDIYSIRKGKNKIFN